MKMIENGGIPQIHWLQILKVSEDILGHVIHVRPKSKRLPVPFTSTDGGIETDDTRLQPRQLELQNWDLLGPLGFDKPSR